MSVCISRSVDQDWKSWTSWIMKNSKSQRQSWTTRWWNLRPLSSYEESVRGSGGVGEPEWGSDGSLVGEVGEMKRDQVSFAEMWEPAWRMCRGPVSFPSLCSWPRPGNQSWSWVYSVSDSCIVAPTWHTARWWQDEPVAFPGWLKNDVEKAGSESLYRVWSKSLSKRHSGRKKEPRSEGNIFN